MSSKRWERIKHVFALASEVEGAERQALLERECSGDDELLSEVRGLLEGLDDEDDFLQAPPAGGSRPKAALARPQGRPWRLVGGDYELLEEIGTGLLGTVHRAKQLSLGRTVAVKLLGSLGAKPGRAVRLEATETARLEHPNIVGVHAVGEENGAPFIAMDHVDGPSLELVLGHVRERRSGDFAGILGDGTGSRPARAAQIALGVAEALQHAHENGTLHRDVKPGNILLDAHGGPHVVDFGLAQDLSLEELLQDEAVAGTRHYQSPEQTLGEELDERSDVFSLGVVLYEMLTLRRPFDGASSAEVFRSIRKDRPVAIRQIQPRVPRALETICSHALEKDPERRYESAGALASDLRRFLDHEALDWVVPPSPLERMRRALARHPWTALTCAVLLLALAFLSVRACSG